MGIISWSEGAFNPIHLAVWANLTTFEISSPTNFWAIESSPNRDIRLHAMMGPNNRNHDQSQGDVAGSGESGRLTLIRSLQRGW